MKRLSDYKGEEALNLWVDLLEPITNIFADKEMITAFKSGKPKMLVAKDLLSKHREDAEKILLRIDDTPLNGLNVLTRLVAIIVDIGENEDIKPFFASAVQGKMENESSGSPTENTEDAEN